MSIFRKKRVFPKTTKYFTGEFGSKTRAGVSITKENSLAITAVYACVSNLSEDIATLPFHLFKKIDGNADPIKDHPVAKIFTGMANPILSGVDLLKMIVIHNSIYGSFYAEKVFDDDFNLKELWPIHPDDIEPYFDEKGELLYKVRGVDDPFPFWKIFRVTKFSKDGVNGISPIQNFKEMLGFTKAVNEFGSRFFGEGTNIGGFLEMEKTMSPEAFERIKKQFNEQYAGLQNAHRVIVLEEGSKFQKVAIPLEDCQFIESKQFQIEDIARIYRVPPHLIGHLEKSTFSNITQQSLEYVSFSLRPWLVLIEQSIKNQLLTPSEVAEGYFVNLKTDGLLRGDSESRFRAYHTALQDGWMNRNEVRALENLNPMGPEGDKFTVQLNMTDIKDLPQNQDGGNENE